MWLITARLGSGLLGAGAVRLTTCLSSAFSYARVSTEDQITARQQQEELRAAGCTQVVEEHASGGDRIRPVLTQVLAQLRPGDILVLVFLDRLTHSPTHLLEVTEGLQGRRAFFRILKDAVDTASPQSLFILQVLGAAAQLERALLRKCTKAAWARRPPAADGPAAPGCARNPEALRRVSEALRAAHLQRLIAGADAWLPTVRRFQAEARRWEEVVRSFNARRPAGAPTWKEERLLRGLRRFVAEGLTEPEQLPTAPRVSVPDRLLAVVAGIVVRSGPVAKLRQIAARLEAMRELTPRGGTDWKPGSITHVLARARKARLLDQSRGMIPVFCRGPGDILVD